MVQSLIIFGVGLLIGARFDGGVPGVLVVLPPRPCWLATRAFRLYQRST
ncbi:hypothetical protein CLV30_11312 [Haloactinopolyspora alba]|uniref:Uncharacterized protein n=1 Tax=Haloactinopolyspora alba TaxID=648780 RepID=A0A2P8DWG0_9ACTN|nr:hypothetical protein CLV30_11312 [Haloactinopolyspora alba]